MPSTTPWNIPYPDGPTNLTALQTHFANIANAINSALSTGLGGAPRLANSDAERLTLFPSPIQGNTVLRPDKGFLEQYYGLYSGATNPSGATPAGWYPMPGSNVIGTVVKSNSAATVGAAAWTIMRSNLGWDLPTYTAGASSVLTWDATVGGWYATVGGMYEVVFEFNFDSSGTMLIGLGKNLTAYADAGSVAETGHASTSGRCAGNITRILKLAAGEYVNAFIFPTVSPTLPANRATSNFSTFRYLGPPQ